MCGIAGIILKQNSDISDLQPFLDRMNQAMKHRGPDDEGCFISSNGRVGLANRRLAIRDLSSMGHMPMSDEERSLWITYNGELYNTEMLRSELEKLGYRFRSTTDTEVILKGYEEWGSEVLERLRGMFAFAIYDERSSQLNPQLLLARDHLGIKPLYYAETSSVFIFASELKVILASGLVGYEVNPTGLTGYFLTGSVPNPFTIYRDIKSLEPASSLCLRLPECKTGLKPYWQFPSGVIPIDSIDEAVLQIRELLVEAVRAQMISDVPLGAFLSGGLDSSSVVALMRQATTGDIRTCSMIFEESNYSEAKYAQSVADSVGSNHFERVITASDVFQEFDHILNSLDQPSNDGVNSYFVSQTARQAGLTVSLSGLGGDELFGGYPNTFKDVPRIYRALKIINSTPVSKKLAKSIIQTQSSHQKWRLIGATLDHPPSLLGAYWGRRGFFTPTEASQLIHPNWYSTDFNLSQYLGDQLTNQHELDEFAQISKIELLAYTHNQLLRDTDVMSMAHSLEVRVPLLDHRLVETALSLPMWAKTGGKGEIKPLLARAMKNNLPPLVVNRQDKQGFTFPMNIWLRGPLKEKSLEVIAEIKRQNWINPQAIDSIINQYAENKIHWSRIWGLVALASIALQRKFV